MKELEKYMHRALQLASYGAGHVSPNPMVGAVIVSADGRIIGEGFHRQYGGPHAEVNAVASVRDEDKCLLQESTIFVTLEPCSHYGKTPPCALLLRDTGFHRVVVGTGDPNPKVAGKGVQILREAGIEVVENVLQEECLKINERFFTAQTLKRPWIMLKWAQSADAFIAAPERMPVTLSSPSGLSLMHAQRAATDAILVGTDTLLADNPSLTTRFWPGHSPRPVIFESERLKGKILKVNQRDPIVLDPKIPLEENMHSLFAEYGVTSLMVEGGAKLLESFIKARLYDQIRVETSPTALHDGIKAPNLPVPL